MSSFDRLHPGRPVVCDGAMGTALQEAGAPAGGCLELMNLDRPDAVRAVHRDHLEAGAMILQTNSFGGSPARLAAHGLEGRCDQINRAAAAIARGVAESRRLSAGSIGHAADSPPHPGASMGPAADSRPHPSGSIGPAADSRPVAIGTVDRSLVAGSIGPTGLLLEPLGPLRSAEALEGFRRQAEALAAGGCDLIVVETMTDLAEAVLAVRAAAATGLPVIASMTFEITPRGIFTVFGATPGRAAADLEAAGAVAIGTNCGTGPASMIEVVRALKAATPLPILVRPNAGIPALSQGRLAYPESPAAFASHVAPLVEAGASIVGGCCGTTAAHVRAIAGELKRLSGRDWTAP